MVSKLISGKDVRGALNYNEQKVMEGKATLIQASGFLKEPEALSFYEKLNRFTDLNVLNRRTKTNTLHISLNFDPSENISRSKLSQIASTYMEWIGFGDQPYLVYQHNDAAHPHVHIVTTLIQNDGKRIPIHYLGQNVSEKARKEIELEFGLIQAESMKSRLSVNEGPISVSSKPVYGKSETKRSISNVVRTITQAYKYTSLAELNAILRLYNVMADRGSERSQMYAKKGLLYSLIDEKGNGVGIPIKASAISGKPTLKNLEKKFALNEILRAPFKKNLKGQIDAILREPGVSTKEQFRKMLEGHQVDVIYRTNTEGRTYGVTFVDHNTKSVFNGSDLGKAYSAAAILDRLAKPGEQEALRSPEQNISEPWQKRARKDFREFYEPRMKHRPDDPIKDLMRAEDKGQGIPESITPSRKRKRRKRKI